MEHTIITPIPDRTDMALFAEMYFKQTGAAAEVGVWQGEFAAHNLKFWKGKYWLCDAWAHRDDGSKDKNMKEREAWTEVLNTAMSNVSFAKDRVFTEIGTSIEIAERCKDGIFDWIFIDAGHTYKDVIEDLKAWWPKLREGGLFSGDDYGEAGYDRWKNRFGGFADIYNWGVISAVEEFAAEVQRQIHITWMNDKTTTPSWYIIK